MPRSPSAVDVPLLVVSCDRYADLWKPFFELFWQRWPDCPFRVHLGTNHRTWDDPRVTSLKAGDDVSWASGVRRMLDQLDADYVILFLEDFLLKAPVSTASVIRLVEVAIERRASCVRLSPLPPPSRLPRQPDGVAPFLGIVESGTPYRVSAQPAIWRADVLRQYLVPGFSAWEFELLGSQMSDYKPDQFWGPFEPTIVYDHGVEKGRWKQEGLRICREAGVSVDLDARQAFSADELEAHHRAGVADSAVSAAKLAAIDTFLQGHRMEGLSRTLALLAARPGLLQLWAIAIFGVAGPGALRWLRLRHLRRRVRQALARETSANARPVTEFL